MKYHLGTSFNRPTSFGKEVHLSLLANPSHLEAVNPIVLGKCRARQFYEDDPTGRATMPILLHGDGSFSGQVQTPPLLKHAVCGGQGTPAVVLLLRACGMLSPQPSGTPPKEVA